TVVRNGLIDAPATVNYSVQDNSARAGNDYQATSGTLNFAAGQASATFAVPLNAAASFADTRTATLTLANPSGGTLGFPTATLNLTGIMPTVPVSITSTSTPHTRTHHHSPQTPSTSTSAGAPAPTPSGTTPAAAAGATGSTAAAGATGSTATS